MNQIRIFFSGRLVGILCTLVSITAINSIQQTIDNLGWDNSFSIAAAKNMSESHGYSVRLASTQDISKAYYEPLNKWPPGYSVLLVMVHAITSQDWIQNAFLLNAIGLTLLVLLFRKMLLQLDYPIWVIHLSVLYFGFIFHSFLGVYFTDIFGLLFFMTGCSLLVQYVKNKENNFNLVALSAFLFAFSAWQKYLYFGLAFIPLISLLFFGWKRKIKKIQMASAVGLCVTGFLISLLIYFQFRNTGSGAYIKPSSKTGFFPLQLLGLTPVVPESFLNLDFINMQISTHSRISYKNVYIFWSIINFFCLCFIAYVGWPIIKSADYFKKRHWNFYVLMSLSVSVYIFIFLGSLTVRYNSHYEDMAYPWVFVGIPRYFAPFCFLIFQFFVFLFLKPSLFPNRITLYLFRILMVCIMLEEIGHGTYFFIKQIFIKKEFGLQRPADQKELRSFRIVKTELAKKEAIVVCAGIPEISNYSSLLGISSIMDPSYFLKPIYSSKEVLVVTTLDSFTIRHMPAEFFKMDTRLVERQSGYSYYFTRVHPNISAKP
jgi:hypothetical protein